MASKDENRPSTSRGVYYDAGRREHHSSGLAASSSSTSRSSRSRRYNSRKLTNPNPGKHIAEKDKLFIDVKMQDFRVSEEESLEFPVTLTSQQRYYIHSLAANWCYSSKSYGKEPHRYIVVYREKRLSDASSGDIDLCEKSQAYLKEARALLKLDEDVHGKEPKMSFSTVMKKWPRRCSSWLPPLVPHKNKPSRLQGYRQSLPIWGHKEEILKLMSSNQVMFIKGDTGCGKTTQVPQFVLDDYIQKQMPVRVICTVPRRIAAISICERVSNERGRKVGTEVGYEIRLESSVSPNETVLTYCTPGILLKAMSSTDLALQNVTHIFLDEVHERDSQSDFLITCIREFLPRYPNLKLILMGADLYVDLFTNYFGGPEKCVIVVVEGRIFPVESYCLEDILFLLKYGPERLTEDIEFFNSYRDYLPNAEADRLIQDVWVNSNPDSAKAFIQMVSNNVVPVDYQHTDPNSDVSMLMATAASGMLEEMMALLELGASSKIKSSKSGNSCDALEWAQWYSVEAECCIREVNAKREYSSRIDLLESYQSEKDDDKIDLPLILQLLHHIHTTTPRDQAILLFLTGYDDIITMKYLILDDVEYPFGQDTVDVHVLHSNVHASEQRFAFQRPQTGIRKIVLATNIAETSLTIEDIVYVVDCGKVKQKSLDVLTGTTQLKDVWISKASANQRKGRAGRCRNGICYRLFSSRRYDAFETFAVPEIHRSSLEALCLQARQIISSNEKIENFFERLPEPPWHMSVSATVRTLTAMGALDQHQQLTNLGEHLLHFSIEPRLGKAIIYAIVCECLEPVLTIIATMTHRDPFVLPLNPQDRVSAQAARQRFSHNAFSDHRALLAVVKEFEKASKMNQEQRFCRTNYVSAANIKMVTGIRSQLLGQIKSAKFACEKVNTNSENWPLVKAILAMSMYPNLAYSNVGNRSFANRSENKIIFSRNSSLSDQDSVYDSWMFYDELSKQNYYAVARGCTLISPLTVAMFVGNVGKLIYKHHPTEPDASGESSDETSTFAAANINIDSWISLKGLAREFETIIGLREELESMILRRLENPTTRNNKVEDKVIELISRILLSEDEAIGLAACDVTNNHRNGYNPNLPRGLANGPRISNSSQPKSTPNNQKPKSLLLLTTSKQHAEEPRQECNSSNAKANKRIVYFVRCVQDDSAMQKAFSCGVFSNSRPSKCTNLVKTAVSRGQDVKIAFWNDRYRMFVAMGDLVKHTIGKDGSQTWFINWVGTRSLTSAAAWRAIKLISPTMDFRSGEILLNSFGMELEALFQQNRKAGN